MVSEPSPELLLPDATGWRSWLAEHHADADGVRLVLAKKGVTEPTRLSYAEALTEALCFGWIDGQIGRRDDRTYYQRFTHRRPRSRWSQTNVAAAEALIASGRMQAPGLAEVERARADGRWETAYAGSSSIEVPADLQAALDAAPAAAQMFARLSRQNRYAILFRLSAATQLAIRNRKIDQYVTMLARGETIYPQAPRRG